MGELGAAAVFRATGSIEPLLRGDVKEKGQGWREASRCDAVGIHHDIERESTAIPLIGSRRVGESVAYHDLSGLQRGCYLLGN